MKRRHVLQAMGLVAAASCGGVSLAASSDLPRDSVFQLDTRFVDQNGRAFTWNDVRGTPTIVSMFYTSCQYVCPMMIEAVRATQQQLSAAEREHVNVVMVTFDPENDTVAVLKKTAQERQADGAHWRLARTSDASQVRKLAAVLGIQYKALPGGAFNHTADLILLDSQGRMLGRTSQLAGADPAFVRLVQKTVAKATASRPD